MKKKVLVLGIGNPNFKDDGVGIELLNLLKTEIPEELKNFIEFEEAHYLDYAFIEKWRGFKKVLIIDGVESGRPPGTIIEIDGRKTWTGISSSGTHNVSIFEIIKTGDYLYPDEMPEEIKILGIEVKETKIMEKGLSEEVKKALESALKRSLSLLKTWLS